MSYVIISFYSCGLNDKQSDVTDEESSQLQVFFVIASLSALGSNNYKKYFNFHYVSFLKTNKLLLLQLSISFTMVHLTLKHYYVIIINILKKSYLSARGTFKANSLGALQAGNREAFGI